MTQSPTLYNYTPKQYKLLFMLFIGDEPRTSWILPTYHSFTCDWIREVTYVYCFGWQNETPYPDAAVRMYLKMKGENSISPTFPHNFEA